MGAFNRGDYCYDLARSIHKGTSSAIGEISHLTRIIWLYKLLNLIFDLANTLAKRLPNSN